MPEPAPSVGAAETVVGRTVVPSAGSPSANGLGAAPSAAIVIWPFVVFGAGTVTPLLAVTVFAPGEPKGVTVPSNAYVADSYVPAFGVPAFPPVPKIAGKSTDARLDCASLAVEVSLNEPAWLALSQSFVVMPS